MGRRNRVREHIGKRSRDFILGSWRGLFKFSEFFFAYLKYTAKGEWAGSAAKSSQNIEYLLTTYDDCATAPPV